MRRPAFPSPFPIEAYAQQFDDRFVTVNQRYRVRRYLEEMRLSAERNKTLTALANAEPITGAEQPGVQHLQWFLSESTLTSSCTLSRTTGCATSLAHLIGKDDLLNGARPRLGQGPQERPGLGSRRARAPAWRADCGTGRKRTPARSMLER
ncbi:hypothetical protein NITHO_2890005 [Nitrolancea hollandica Lb]|uniref:Uncharacterized protein n=1 Tax=Nitrolancea hollandica Lb TaxID=1129897 RepID=I4EGX8_9BACT|nr:hypothetical protein NITHO_2890005 [Nitrolancea hollandica Lb]